MKEKKYKEAVIEYKNAVKAGPKDAALRFKLAKAALEAKDIRTAFQELQKAVELDPDSRGQQQHDERARKVPPTAPHSVPLTDGFVRVNARGTREARRVHWQVATAPRGYDCRR